jgi:predicted unusual protein kinase regulating ubiquinone biosynthesis (AarF/ABC1/UbiB family)
MSPGQYKKTIATSLLAALIGLTGVANAQTTSYSSVVRSPAAADLYTAAPDEMDLFRFWVQDRFIRTVSWAKTDAEKLQALSALIQIAEKSKEEYIMRASVENVPQLEDIRVKLLHPQESTHKEIAAFLRAEAPNKLVITGSGEAKEKILKINSAYRRLMDHEFSFPPKTMTGKFLSFLHVVKTRNVSFFDLLFEKSFDSNLAIKGLKAMPDNEKLVYLNQLQSQVSKLFGMVKNSGTEVLEKSNITIEDPRAKRFVEIVLTEYFKALPNETIWNIIFLQMEKPEIESMMERFKLFSQNVGPQFHKLFQVLASNPKVPPNLAEVFKSFQEDLPPANSKAVVEILDKSQFKEFEILEYDPKPVKVGSMAQVHRAKVKFHHNGQETWIALRVLKPGVREMLEMDNRILDQLVEKVVNDPLLGKATEGINYGQMIEELKKLVLEELDVEKTFASQKNATQMLVSNEAIILASGIKVNIRVPKAYMSNNADVMASDWAYGESLEDFYNKDKESGKQIAEAIFKNWLEKAVLTTGFVHADLQMGNVKVERLLHTNEVDAHILDYGMAGVLAPEGRQLFILLSIGTATKNARLVARAIMEQSVTKPDITAEQVEALLKVHFESLSHEDQKQVIEKTLELLTKNGFSFDGTFMKLVRGYSTARGLLHVTESTRKPSDMVMEIFKAHPKLLLSTLQSARFLKMEDIVGVLKGFGGSMKDYAVNNPQAVAEAGAALFDLGKKVFSKTAETVSDASQSEVGQAVKGKIGGLFGKFKNAIAEAAKPIEKPVPPIASGINKCLGFYGN